MGIGLSWTSASRSSPKFSQIPRVYLLSLYSPHVELLVSPLEGPHVFHTSLYHSGLKLIVTLLGWNIFHLSFVRSADFVLSLGSWISTGWTRPTIGRTGRPLVHVASTFQMGFWGFYPGLHGLRLEHYGLFFPQYFFPRGFSFYPYNSFSCPRFSSSPIFDETTHFPSSPFFGGVILFKNTGFSLFFSLLQRGCGP